MGAQVVDFIENSADFLVAQVRPVQFGRLNFPIAEAAAAQEGLGNLAVRLVGGVDADG